MTMDQHMNGYTLKIIGALMTYPTAELQQAASEMAEILKQESWLSGKILKELESFIADIAVQDLLDLQENYVSLFDRTPSLSLHLFEHVHGDSRDRGQALVELDMLYREIGLENISEHTPDFLPLFLEYLSQISLNQARHNLDGAIDVIAVVGERLKKRSSPYAVLFESLKEAASSKPDEKKLAAALKAHDGTPLSQDEMDEAWEEQFAFDNPDVGQSGCPKAQDMLARINEDLPKTEARK
ncbi:MAG: nitrate reductase molybdenum cofactor assembly chaperone [Alphaproteobacteria bacterium CG_4_9_14_3_um_filter_47_13]|nr:MAG: nitrate reductase molybdenum cofactor assembly chaperone [Alphaproteobacteria bacterium CG_4_9_14_3_um_filter_47_13]